MKDASPILPEETVAKYATVYREESWNGWQLSRNP